MQRYNVLVNIFLLVIVGFLIYFILKTENDPDLKTDIAEMQKKNDLIKDSLERIIAEGVQKDNIYKRKIDSLSSQLEIIKGLASKMSPRLNVINDKIRANTILWEELNRTQKDSVILSAIKLSR